MNSSKAGRTANLDSTLTPRQVAATTHAGQPALWLFYHYLYPDPVVSAVHMHQLCRGLAEHGWNVTGIAGNRGCRDEHLTYPPHAQADGITLRRIWRPAFRQSSTLGRLLNAAWMITAWSALAFSQEPPEVVIIGTDPVLAVLTTLLWKFVNPDTRILHWCFDLYPEAAFADGLLAPGGWLARALAPLLRRAYNACDAIVDLGPCMRQRLDIYVESRPPLAAPLQRATIVPWALYEPAAVLPPAVAERRLIAGDHRLSMLYSGSFGRAHTSVHLFALARALQGADAALAFSVQGNCEPALRAEISAMAEASSCDVRQVPFAPAENVLDRLAAPDVHVITLADHWTGLVVPSKCFGALAVGRPLLFSGSRNSAIALWIQQYHLGWVLDAGNVEAVSRDLLAYVDDPERVQEMQQRCFATYQQYFSRRTGIDHMQALLEAWLPR